MRSFKKENVRDFSILIIEKKIHYPIINPNYFPIFEN